MQVLGEIAEPPGCLAPVRHTPGPRRLARAIPGPDLQFPHPIVIFMAADRVEVDQTTGLVYFLAMTMVNVQEAKAQLSRLLGLVEAGEEIVIARYGKPVAKLVRIERPTSARVPGTWKGAIEIAPDFDEELPEDWLEPLEP